MRIGIGAILGVVGGPATYARELVRGLARVDSTNDYFILTDAPNRLDVSAPHVTCVQASLPSPFLQPVWDHVWIPALVRRHRLHLYHGTKGILPFVGACPEVVTVHDLAVYQEPQSFSYLQRLHLQTHTPYTVRRAKRVIADSESGRQDLVARFHLPESRVTVVPLAAGSQFHEVAESDDVDVAQRLQLPPRYVLYAGTVQPRKNVEMLVQAFTGLGETSNATLLIAGRLRPGYRPSFVSDPPSGVRYLGPVSDQELAVLYRRALALCSPSSYEGFGLSLLEAMTSGCLVIAGRNSSVTELVGDCGLLLPDLTADAVRAALARVLAGDAALESMRNAALARAKGYGWDETARRTLEVYRSVLQEVGSGG